jgi:UDP-N-acetylglucosamine 1-carboxyvinyltransferase
LIRRDGNTVGSGERRCCPDVKLAFRADRDAVRAKRWIAVRRLHRVHLRFAFAHRDGCVETLVIQGGTPLRGTVSVSGSKNAALPIMAATLAADGPCVLHRVPDLADVRTLTAVLERLGMKVDRGLDGALRIECRDSTSVAADYDLVRKMRASVCVLGPLLGRRGRARVALPGGCNIGHRPIDLHLKGLAALGADIRIEHGDIVAEAPRLRGAVIDLAGPFGSTVTGTCNVMTAAVFAEGTTVICSAAREPEVIDLANFLNELGARIEGQGTDVIEIHGPCRLGGGSHSVIADRIEAATLVMAVGITSGEATLKSVCPAHLSSVLELARSMGIEITPQGSDSLMVRGPARLSARDVEACPYPGVPTDVQAQFTALLCLAEGTGRVIDRVFPDRFLHIPELQRMGAQIEPTSNGMIVRGAERLSGAAVRASDLRASAALILAGLAAEGETTVHELHHLDRGYERLEDKLRSLGANVHRTTASGGRQPPEAV